MRRSMPDITRTVTPDGELLVIEADSVEDALAAVPDATPEHVVTVERVARGGVGGFFAREAFVVTLRPPQPAVHDVDADDEDDWLAGEEIPERYVVDARPTGLDAVIAQLAAEEDSKEVSFGALLQQHRQAPPLRAPAPAPAPVTPAVDTPPATPMPLRHPVEARKPLVRAWTPPRLEDRTAPVVPAQAPVEPAPAARSLGEVLAASLDAPTLPGPRPEPAVPVTWSGTDAVAPSIPPPPGAPSGRAVTAVSAVAPPAPPAPHHPPVVEPTDVPAVVLDEQPQRALRATVSAAFRDELAAPAPSRPALDAPRPRPSLSSSVATATVDTPRRAAVQRSGDAAWSMDALLDVGIPESLLIDLPPADPRDEYAWMRSLADALSPLCRPLPVGPSLYAGPLADVLAGSLDGVPVLGGAPFVAPDQDAAVVVREDEAARSWLAHARGERWLQLVVGGGDTRALRGSDPLAVSWVGDEALPEALTLAARRGLVLGYGLDASRGSRAHRAHPIDLSVAIRRLLPREGDR